MQSKERDIMQSKEGDIVQSQERDIMQSKHSDKDHRFEPHPGSNSGI